VNKRREWLDFDRGLNLEFMGCGPNGRAREGIIMDVKKFFADLIAMYRKPTEPPPPAPGVDAGAAPKAGRKAGNEAGHAEEDEASRKAGYEDDHAERYEAGHKKYSDEGVQIDLESKTPPEPSPPPEQPSQAEPPAEEPPSS
jgi:hypothetical protein